MKAEQLTLDLPRRAAQGREDFLVSPSNAGALAQLDDWMNWQVPRLALCGPHGAGKSHLARVWAGESGATVLQARDLAAIDLSALDATAPRVVEDADRIGADPEAERALFHLFNLMAEARSPLVLTGTEPPSRWSIDLPDLASRLAAMPVAAIGAPDDSLLEAILVKLFSDRQINVTPDLIAYLLARIDRSVAAAERVVDALDRAALRERRAVTRPFAVDVLRRIGLSADLS